MKLSTSAATALALLTAPVMAQDKDWNFSDGVDDERWSLLNTDYALCDAGLNQSPIDLGTPNAVGDVQLSHNYGPANGTMALGEEKVQVNFGEGMGMNSGGTMFNLIQVHFHTPAEHAIDGERQPLVAHFVHATDDGKLGVLGVTFAEGAANPALAQIMPHLGDASVHNGMEVSFDITDMVPEDLGVYRYMGSLTTPPCSEGVNWHVAETVLSASAEQIRAIYDALGPSARSLQPQGNRLVVAPVN
ncbi:carbonic anhydrase [Aurantiacibacter aquimixticola]|uniref:carbonic anhydrase n=1 Tax=Aurantiacibacter aquimixticola TaxID=1958945 RepID=A0A419RSE4_9SPHN|nr:carbonic anhydrase family protein [Aurantiacibacter aquimixticola]RJY08689.1 carbonic anhydrase family protein [Aurantiacibacter aquimixticola]